MSGSRQSCVLTGACYVATRFLCVREPREVGDASRCLCQRGGCTQL